MNEQETLDFVIRELGKHHPKNDIIQKLCESNSMNWNQAEKFVRQIESQNSSLIAQKQSPMVTIMGTGMVIVGSVIAIWIIYITRLLCFEI